MACVDSVRSWLIRPEVSSSAPPVAPPAFADEMRADVAGRAVAFTAGADMEFVIGQYTHGFEEAFNTYEEKGYGLLPWSNLGWGDAQAPRLLAALEYVRDHYPEGATKMSIRMFDGNTFSKKTKAKLKQVCETFVDTDSSWWDLKEGEKSGSCCTIL